MVEIYINNTLMDMPAEGVQFPLNYSVADIREPSKRTQPFSKTIKLPSTKTNDKLFTHAFDVNRNGGYDVNTKADCLVLRNGVEVFRGYARLSKITQSVELKFDYDIVIYGKLANIFIDFGKDKLSDLDFSEFNHNYTQANQSNSWDTSIIQNSTATAFEYGNGYVYPLIDYGYSANQVDYKVNQLYPALYVKEIWDKIFSTYGYSYESTFIDSDRFKKLIVPFSGARLELSNAQIEDRLFLAGNRLKQELLCTEVSTNNSDTVEFDSDSTGNEFDNGNNFNIGTYSYTVPDTGYYAFQSRLFLGIRLVPDTTASVTPNAPAVEFWYRILKNGNVISAGSLEGAQLSNVPAFTTSYESANTVSQPDPNGVWNLGYDANYSNLVVINIANQLFNAGDVISVEFLQSTTFTQYASTNNFFANEAFTDGATDYGGEYYFQIKTGSTFFNKVNNIYVTEGGTVDMSNVLPKDVEIKTFLNSLIKMFNLYVEQDEDNEKNYFIEPRNDFYDNGSNYNLEDKLDMNSPQEIIPMGALDAGRYLYTYKEDKDYYNQKYIETWGEIYGEEFKDINNDFIKNEVKTEVIFSPTPVADTGFSDMVMPRIFQEDSNGSITPIASNIRILQYTGLRNITGQNWNHTSDLVSTVSYNNYPYCGHLDDPFNPTFDLNFGVVKEVYYDDLYTTLNWTDANLYNEYHRKFIEEITDPNSIMFIGFFDLSPKDIYDLDFRNNYYFLNAYWRLNKVIDYNPNSNALTKCEFIKLKDAPSFSATTGEVIGGQDEIGEYVPPKLKTVVNYNNNNYNERAQDVDVNGKDNTVAYTARSVEVIGDGNVIGADTERITIDGSNNVVNGGLTDVTLINSDNLEITESNVTYINGVKVFAGNMQDRDIVTKDADYTMTTSDRTVLVDSSTGTITITLPLAGAEVEKYRFQVVKLESANNVILDPSADILINGETTLTMTEQWESVDVECDGTKYYIV